MPSDRGFQAGGKAGAGGKMRGRAAGQRLIDDVDKFDVLVVDEVVGHRLSRALNSEDTRSG